MTANPDLYFRQIPIGPMENFLYFIGSQRTRECFVVDPAWDTDAILGWAAEDDMKIVGSLVTHYHPDHCGGGMMGFDVPGGVGELAGRVDAPIHVNKHEAEGLKLITGVSDSDLVLHDSGDRITIGDVEVKALHTPGHTPGGQCFLVENRLVAGDTLFVGGCGRVDLPGADPEQMYETLTTRLAKLDDDVVLYPGHDYGPTKTSTMAHERRTNVHLQMPSLAHWMRLRGM